MIAKLISGNINFSKNKSYSSRRISNLEIEITFSLAIPSYVKDDELVTQANHSILYCQNLKRSIPKFLVTLVNVKDAWYPNVTNNKFFRIKKVYNLKDWLMSGENFHTILTQDREKIFREVKANITLEKIGQLTKKWNDINDGNYNSWTKDFNYGYEKSIAPRPASYIYTSPTEYKF